MCHSSQWGNFLVKYYWKNFFKILKREGRNRARELYQPVAFVILSDMKYIGFFYTSSFVSKAYNEHMCICK